MKAMVLEGFNQPLVLKDVTVPQVKVNEALVKVKTCGICATDLKIITGKIPWIKLPHIMGHEVSGEIVEVGSGVTSLKKGDRVVAYLYVTCGQCANCLSGNPNICTGEIQRIGYERYGGFAEYVNIPGENLFKIPDSLTYEQAPLLADAILTVLHAIRDKAKVTATDTVLVVGIGGLGVHAVQLAKIYGAKVIAVDIREEPLQLAEKFGADALINSSKTKLGDEIKKITDGIGVDAVLDHIGSPESLNNSLLSLKRGGRVVSVGYSPDRPALVDTFQMHYNEWQLLGTRYGNKSCMLDAINLVETGRVIPYVGKKYPLESLNEAFNTLKNGQVVGRIVIGIDTV